MAQPLIGAKISLVSKSEVRYQGILYNVDPHEHTVALQHVKAFGTEGRRQDGPQIPPNPEVFEYVIFRGADIKDLEVCEAPAQSEKAPPAFEDPAIVSAGRMPPQAQQVPQAQSAQAPPQAPPQAPLQAPPQAPRGGQHDAGHRNNQKRQAGREGAQSTKQHQPPPTSYAGAAQRAGAAGSAQTSAWGAPNQRPSQRGQNRDWQGRQGASRGRGQSQGGRGNRRGGGGGGGGGGGTGSHNGGAPRAAPGTGSHLLHRPVRQAVQGATVEEGDDFDFATMNERFNKDTELAKAQVPSFEEEPAYDKSSSFFDSLSCDITDRQMGRATGLYGAQERELNKETFGAAGINHGNRNRHGGGRGRGRGGGRGGGGRGRGRGGPGTSARGNFYEGIEGFTHGQSRA